MEKELRPTGERARPRYANRSANTSWGVKHVPALNYGSYSKTTGLHTEECEHVLSYDLFEE